MRDGTIVPSSSSANDDDDAQHSHYYLGSSIDVVGDVACVVSDYLPDGSGEPKVYVFRRANGEWTQFRR